MIEVLLLNLIPQVSGTCRSLSLSSDLKSLSIITEVRSPDNNPEICYIQVKPSFTLSFSSLFSQSWLYFHLHVCFFLAAGHRVVVRLFA